MCRVVKAKKGVELTLDGGALFQERLAGQSQKAFKFVLTRSERQTQKDVDNR